MIKYDSLSDPKTGKRGARSGVNRIKRIASMGKLSTAIIDEIHSPIDSINRFLNLALMTMNEDAPSRAFLLESKDGVRKTSTLLKKLNDYVKKIEKELKEIQELSEKYE